MTRHEQLRNLTVEQLAHMIVNSKQTDAYCKSDCGDDNDCPHEVACCVRWLNEECGTMLDNDGQCWTSEDYICNQ